MSYPLSIPPLSSIYFSSRELTDILNNLTHAVQVHPSLGRSPSVRNLLLMWTKLAQNNSRTLDIDLCYRRLLRELTSDDLKSFVKLLSNSTHAVTSRSFPPPTQPTFTSQELSISQSIQDCGYYIFASPVDPYTLQLIRNICLDSSLPRSVSGPPLSPLTDSNSQGRYDLTFSDQQQHILRTLFHQPPFTSIAQCYFNGIFPHCSSVIAWYSYSTRTDSCDFHQLRRRAQEFHLDFEGPISLKLFLYLTSVSDSSGPHQLISNRSDHLPNPIRLHEQSMQSGPSAIPPDIISMCLSDDCSLITINGCKGTLFLVDTSRPHRGCVPAPAHGRLILSTTFRISNLGNP